MNQSLNKAFDFIDENRENIVRDLCNLASIPSISQQGKDEFIYSKEVNDALLKSRELYARFGFDLKVNEKDGYAIFISEGKGDGIGLFGHADVVPVNDDWVKTSPFSPKEENGILYGRGVSDNKAGIICSLYALAALKSAGTFPKNKITSYVGGSEETGLLDIAAFVKNEKMPFVNVVPDSDFPVSLGEKGILHIDAKSRLPLSDVVKFEGGRAYNVVLDDVLVKLSDEIKNLPINIYKDNEAHFKGLTAHAAYPEGSENAAYKAAISISECNEISRIDREIMSGFAKCIEGYYGENLGIASSGAFKNLTCCNGIVRVEDDGKLFFTLDIRYGNEISGNEIIKNASKNLEKYGFEVVNHTDDEGFLLDSDCPESKVILDACREVSGISDAEPYLTFGGTYARRLKNAYAINHSAPFDISTLGLPKGHGGPHQSDEALSIDAFITGIKTLAAIILGLDNAI